MFVIAIRVRLVCVEFDCAGGFVVCVLYFVMWFETIVGGCVLLLLWFTACVYSMLIVLSFRSTNLSFRCYFNLFYVVGFRIVAFGV